MNLASTFAANTVANFVASPALSLASTGADAARITGMIIGAAVFLLAGATLLVAMRFRTVRSRDAAKAEAGAAVEAAVAEAGAAVEAAVAEAGAAVAEDTETPEGPVAPGTPQTVEVAPVVVETEGQVAGTVEAKANDKATSKRPVKETKVKEPKAPKSKAPTTKAPKTKALKNKDEN